MQDEHAALRRKLKKCNLSELSRLCGIPVRTLRRIRHGTSPVRDETVQKMAPHIEASTMGRDENAKRAERAAITRALNGGAS